MTKAVLTKFLLLVILTFIICIPEFFTLYRVSKVNFLCSPYQPCEQGNQVKMEGDGRPGITDNKGKDICAPSLTLHDEKWKRICTQEDKNSLTDSAPETWSVGDDPKMNWFMCDADNDMEELLSRISSSALYLEVSVKLQLNPTETLNLTLYGRSNNSLNLHLPEEEEGEMGDDERQKEALYCCFSLLPTSESTNQSQCLLWFTNQTVLNETAKEKLPWKRTQNDEWRCMFRVIWLALMCVVLLTVAATLIKEIYRGKCCSKKCKTQPTDYNFTSQQIKDGGKQTYISTSKDTAHKSYGFQFWSRLPPIQEAESQEDIETLPDGNVDHSYTAHLHHRSHPPASQRNMSGVGEAAEWC
ncbi:uncharacterized protein LOC121638150 [Melanotaenia boesemani]|uniref:uncharacterized protein LOC121638150 n=1 Tax=Melanotaenia boesemani TaxID=1250792 RepID=UPI001C04D2BF|nr:uncharacterized protein LOC121638150 [Melanotaenia boesemani]